MGCGYVPKPLSLRSSQRNRIPSTPHSICHFLNPNLYNNICNTIYTPYNIYRAYITVNNTPQHFSTHDHGNALIFATATFF